MPVKERRWLTASVANPIGQSGAEIQRCRLPGTHLGLSNSLVRKYRRVEADHMDAHKACVAFITQQEMDIDELFALHNSALEPPEFLPTPTYPEMEMLESGWESM